MKERSARYLPWIASALMALIWAGCRGQATPQTESAPTPIPTLTEIIGSPTTVPEPTQTPDQPEPAQLGQIVYTCQLFAEGLYDQICLMEPDGSDSRRLTTNDQADHFYPSLTPAGKSVLFASNLAGPYEIYEQDLEGQPLRLTHQGNNYAPAASPDGSLIVYTHTDDEQAALWLMKRDGSQSRFLIGQAWDGTWSPDGAWILHASDRGGSVQLWRVRPDGRDLRQITQLDGLRGRSDWSSTGLLATYAGTSWQREIITFDLQGEQFRQITNGGNNLAPSFSPDGNWIVFTSYADNYLDENGCEIYNQHLASGRMYRLTDNAYCDWQPRWGPDEEP